MAADEALAGGAGPAGAGRPSWRSPEAGWKERGKRGELLGNSGVGPAPDSR